MQIKLGVIFLLLVLIGTSSADQFGGAFLSPGIDGAGFDSSHPYFGAGFGASVDAFSGALVVSETDASLPGRNGLGFSLVRTYSSNIYNKADFYPPGDIDLNSPKWLGVGWNFNMGRIKFDYYPDHGSLGPILVEWPDGSTSFWIQDSSDQFPSTAILSDFSRVTVLQTNSACTLGADESMSIVITRPDGTRYLFNHWVRDGPTSTFDEIYNGYREGQTVYSQPYIGVYPTRIEDTQGNYLDIRYYGNDGIANPQLCDPSSGCCSTDGGILYQWGSPFIKSIELNPGQGVPRAVNFMLNWNSQYPIATTLDSISYYGYQRPGIPLSKLKVDYTYTYPYSSSGSNFMRNLAFLTQTDILDESTGQELYPPKKYEYWDYLYDQDGDGYGDGFGLKKIISPLGGIATYNYGHESISVLTATTGDTGGGDYGYCGDGICGGIETSVSCPYDCDFGSDRPAQQNQPAEILTAGDFATMDRVAIHSYSIQENQDDTNPSVYSFSYAEPSTYIWGRPNIRETTSISPQDENGIKTVTVSSYFAPYADEAFDWKNGLPISTETFKRPSAGPDVLLQRVNNSYGSRIIGGKAGSWITLPAYSTPLLEGVLTEVYDEYGAPKKSYFTNYSAFDRYNNVQKIINYGEVTSAYKQYDESCFLCGYGGTLGGKIIVNDAANPNDEVVTRTDYLHNLATQGPYYLGTTGRTPPFTVLCPQTQIINQPFEKTIYTNDQMTSIASKSQTYYDYSDIPDDYPPWYHNTPYIPGVPTYTEGCTYNLFASPLPKIINGDPTQDRVWDNSYGYEDWTKILYDRDLFGNLVKLTNPSGNSQGYTDIHFDYSSDGYFQKKQYTSDATQGITLSKEISLWDVYSGLPEIILDANNKFTTYDYDSLGRITNVVKPGDSEESPTMQINYYDFERVLGGTPVFVEGIQKKEGNSAPPLSANILVIDDDASLCCPAATDQGTCEGLTMEERGYTYGHHDVTQPVKDALNDLGLSYAVHNVDHPCTYDPEIQNPSRWYTYARQNLPDLTNYDLVIEVSGLARWLSLGNYASSDMYHPFSNYLHSSPGKLWVINSVDPSWGMCWARGLPQSSTLSNPLEGKPGTIFEGSSFATNTSSTLQTQQYTEVCADNTPGFGKTEILLGEPATPSHTGFSLSYEPYPAEGYSSPGYLWCGYDQEESSCVSSYPMHENARAVVSSFELAAINSIEDRKEITRRTINWLLGISESSTGYYTPTKYYFDGLGRNVRQSRLDIEDDMHIVSDTRYNLQGNVYETTRPYKTANPTPILPYPSFGSTLRTTYNEYDALGRAKRITPISSSPAQVQNFYEPNAIRSVDEQGKTAKVINDAYGRAISQTIALGTLEAATTLFTYDTLSNPTRIENPRNQITTQTYNSLSQKIDMTNPDTGMIRYTYDKAGSLASEWDQKWDTTIYTYDGLNRIISIKPHSYGYPNVIYRYDKYDTPTPDPIPESYKQNGKGKLTGLRDDSGTSYYGYDSRGRLVYELKRPKDTSSVDYVTTYVYDSSDNLISMTLPNNQIINYMYNDLDQLNSVVINGEEIMYDYTTRGMIESIAFPNSFTTNFEYTDKDLVAGITTPSVFTRFYDYDDTGNMLHEYISSARSLSLPYIAYQYDNQYRLKQALDSSESLLGSQMIQYAYNDLIGNRQTETVLSSGGGGFQSTTYQYYSGTNRLQNEIKDSDTYTYTYDAIGNLYQKRSVTHPLEYVEYEYYPSSNMLKKITEHPSNGYESYVYDASGRRTKKMINASDEATLYVYDQNGNPVYEKYDRACNLGTIKTYFFAYDGNTCNLGGSCTYDSATAKDIFDNACCATNNCVYKGQCYAPDTSAIVDSKTQSYEPNPTNAYCSPTGVFGASGKWVDPDSSAVLCRDTLHLNYQPSGGLLPGRFPNGFGEYAYSAQQGCCGDDSGEFLRSATMPSGGTIYACCPSGYNYVGRYDPYYSFCCDTVDCNAPSGPTCGAGDGCRAYCIPADPDCGGGGGGGGGSPVMIKGSSPMLYKGDTWCWRIGMCVGSDGISCVDC